MIIEEKKSFVLGTNGDINVRQLPDGAMLNCMNGRLAVSEYGRDMRVENIAGTTLVSQSAYPPYGTQICLGGCVDTANGWILFFLYNTHGDNGIYCYQFSNNTIYPVLYDSQVEGGLGFSKSYRIHSARVANGILYWTDNLNHPRRINIKSGINLNRTNTFPDVPAYSAAPMKKDIITLIRRPPNYPVTIEKVVQSSPVLNNNFIALFSGKFAAYYEYRDGEQSTLSEHSSLVRYNVASESYNRVDVTFSFSEIFPQDIQKIHLAVQYGNSPNFFVVKSWDVDNSTDLAEINAHNNGSTQLTYAFYNDQTGVALDSAFSVKPYDSIPLTSKTLEFIKNRLFLGNNLIGFDTPTRTSLSASLVNVSDGATVTGIVWALVYNGGATTRYVIYIGGIGASSGYYRYTPDDTTPPPDPSAWASLALISANETDVFRYYVPTWPTDPITSFTSTGSTPTISGAPSPTTLIGATCFKSGSPYRIAIAFADRWGRRCGIVRDNTLYQTADRSYSSVAYTTGIQWSLSNTNALTEIPDWAEYYYILRTKNLRTNFFIQARSKNATASMIYATKDVNNEYAYGTTTYASTNAAVAIDITNIDSFGMGYDFSEGDLVKVYISGDSNIYTLKILARDGRWLVCELKNLGTLTTTTNALFEIYTPYHQSVNEPYYETGAAYAINNAGTNSRQYSVLGGTLNGDVTLLDRNTTPDNYLTENMSPNDTYWREWITDTGRPNFVDTIGQQQKKNNVCFSNTIIPGTRINGLSTFEALNQKDFPQEAGEIQKLQIANRVSDDQGNIMLAICTNETISMDIEETTVASQSGDVFIAQSKDVISSFRVLKGSFGTINPESVREYLGKVFWIDVTKGGFIQYSNEGLEDVAKYGQQRFFSRYCKDYLAASTNNLDNINGFHHISVGIDPFSKEVLVTLPALIYENYASTIPSYSSVPSHATSIINRFDIYDQLGKTMSFRYERNQWDTSYQFMPEAMEIVNNRLFAWKEGAFYKMNDDTTNWNRFFGTNYPIRICVVANLNQSAHKDLGGIAIEGNSVPNFTVAYSDYPNIQVTDLAQENYANQQGQFYAPFLKDRLSPNASGTADQKMMEGDTITGIVLFVMAEWQAYTSLTFINFINISYSIAKGQKAITNPANI